MVDSGAVNINRYQIISDANTMKSAIFYCPESCNGKHRNDMREIVEHMKKINADFSYLELNGETPEDIAEFCGSSDVIVIGGGDGTVNRVINATYTMNKPYVLLPFGSGNDFARSFRCPRDGEGLSETLNKMHGQTVDLWELNENTVFVQSIFIGLSIKTIEIKNELGCNGYLKPIIKALSVYEPEHVRVSADNETADGHYLMAAVQNVKTTCNGLKMTPSSKVDDGKLEVIVCPYVGRYRLIMNLLSTKTSWVCNQPNATVLISDRFHIEGDGEMTYTVDGEIRKSAGLDIRLSDRKITVLSL